MANFRELLNEAASGKVALNELQYRVGNLLSDPSNSAADFSDILEHEHRSGTLPGMVYDTMRNYLAQSVPNLEATALPSSDATRVAAPAANEATKLAQGFDATRVKPANQTLPPVGDAGAQLREVGVGTTLKNRFVLEQMIARGGMGVVYKARDLRKEEARDRNPYVAMKVLSDDFKDHPDALISLQREARKAQQLTHPNIVNVYDFDRDGDVVFMTMEYLQGESIEDLIKRIRPNGLPVKEALNIIRSMALALAHAHEHRTVHSDFKPGNVFITEEGVVKVLDFGIARAVQSSGKVAQEQTLFDAASLGALTPAYASCEMFDGEEPDPRDDIYALACVAYELLTGRHPYNRAPAHHARDTQLNAVPAKGISRKQLKALQHGLAFKRKDRTPTALQFLQELQVMKDGEMRASPTQRWAMRGGVAVLAVLSIFLGSYLWYSQKAAEQQSWLPKAPAINLNELVDLTPRARDKILRLLNAAEGHLLIGNYTSPVGSSALFAYESVLEILPNSSTANEGLRSIANYYYQVALRHFEKQEYDLAEQNVEVGLEVLPRYAELLDLQQKLRSRSN